MKVEGTRSFAASRETVWSVLNDPSQMAELMPGVETFDIQDDRHWTANVKVPLGLGGLRMKINFEKLEERELEFAKLRAKGTGVGALMDMTTAFTLADEGGGTAMQWEADVKIAGPVGSMGQRVLQPIVNQQVGNVLTALDKQVSAAAQGGAEQPPRASDAGGDAGTPEPTTDAEVSTEPDLKDYGPPAEGIADPEGSSGAEEGVSPLSEEGYSDEPEGPTQHTQGN